ncbi:Sodium/glucose cotransporter [Rhodobacteraceae bacterium THAF1]|uniref:sodium:solute symporter family transporter n=1 Tax=Palleronia sp. THAF1 TaxID=2587842 RepID=UPI000F411549|nr:sodium/solute symporter [Palleronia sp. THAF1]QFU08457.1 Sodium/glucose cotransporter [Palleronia sp. THAF1]VDC29349.1 Sodium/glucose cotransporter [Rhodobacteraceae bacterium THAF1]
MGEAQFSLAWIDYLIVAAYFIGIIAHGLYVSRKRGGESDDYFLAGRNLGWFVIGFSLFASNMSGSSFVGLMGGAYANGVAIYNYEWTAAIVLIAFAIFILPSYLRARVATTPEFLELRYDVRSRKAYSLFTILAVMLIDVAGALYAGGLVIANTFSFLNIWTAAAVLALIAGIYTVLGGLAAVVVTDTVQSILLIIGGLIIFVLGMNEIGGWSEIWTDVPDAKQHLILPVTNDFTPWHGLWGVTLLSFYLWTMNQFVAQRTLAAKDLRNGQIGALFAGFLKLPNIFIMIIPGIIALKLYPELETPDLAFPKMAFELMPIGLRGLIMAALIAAIMSSVDSAATALSSLVVKDFVQPAKPDWSEQKLVRIGQIATGGFLIFAALYAPLIGSFDSLFGYFQSSLSYIVPTIVATYMVGLSVKWSNGSGAFWTIIGGLVVGIPTFILKEVTGVWESIGLPDLHYTVMGSILFFVGIATNLAISAATRQPNKEGVDALVWSADETKEIFGQIGSPWYFSPLLWSVALAIATTGFLVWLW